MRIALTHAYSWPEVRRGAERFTYELSRALVENGHSVTVLTSGRPHGVEQQDGVKTRRLRRMSQSEARHEQLLGLALVPYLVAEKFDAVHSLGTRDATASIRAARIRRGGRRTVYTNLGIPYRWYWDPRPDGRAHRRVVENIDVYGCMSRFALRVLTEEYGRDGVLTPGGVNLQQFAPAKEREGRPTILFSGAIAERRKGIPVLLEALAILLKTEPSLRLWLSGPGDPTPYFEGVPSRVLEAVEVLPIGDATAQAERYGRAWATALPSVSDSFGMALLESLACGTPIVASTDAALPELVDPGKTGTLCDPKSAASVADALAQALELAGRPGTAESCRASTKRYDWKTSLAPSFANLYEST